MVRQRAQARVAGRELTAQYDEPPVQPVDVPAGPTSSSSMGCQPRRRCSRSLPARGSDWANPGQVPDRRSRHGRYRFPTASTMARSAAPGRVADLVLVRDPVRRRSTVPWHAHASPLLCLVVRGAFEERSRGRSRTLGTGAVLFHPGDEPHAHRFEAPRTRCFSVQLGPVWLSQATPASALGSAGRATSRGAGSRGSPASCTMSSGAVRMPRRSYSRDCCWP